MLKRILGLDLGISSIGWAITENKCENVEDPSFRIVDCGVRLFNEPITRDSSGQVRTSNSKRREKRIGRKRLRRKKLIMLKLKKLFVEKGLATEEQLGIYTNNDGRLDNNLLMLPKGNADKNMDIWQLRSEALERKISDFELCRILLHIAKHRGPDFEKNATLEELEELKELESPKKGKNKKDDEEDQGNEDKDAKKMKSSMLNLRVEYNNAKIENPSITIGKLLFEKREKIKDENQQDIYKDGHAIYAEKDAIRNKSGKYKNIISREFLREEVKKIFEIQSKYDDSGVHKLNLNEIMDLIFSEKEAQNIDNMVGFCELEFKTIKKYIKIKNDKKIKKEIIDIEHSEKRLSKDTFTGQLFSTINSIVTLKIKSMDYNGLLIDHINKDDKKDAIKQVLNLAIFNGKDFRNELTYTQLKKAFLNDDFLFSNLSYKDNSKQKNGKEVKAKTEEEIVKTTENKKFISFSSLYRLNKFLSDTQEWSEIIEEISDVDKIIDFYFDKNVNDFSKKLKVDQIIETVYLNNKEEARKKLKELNYSDNFIDKVINFNFSKTLNLSYKAIRKILPYMLEGKQYMNAIDEIPEYKRKFEKQKDYYLKDYAELELVRNPVVRRIFAETKKVINALIKKYRGNNKTAFHQINIETTRALKDVFSKKKGTDKRDSNSKEGLKKEYLELLGLPIDTFVSSNEIFKFKLLKEQDFKSVYSGKSFMENIDKQNACKLIRTNSYLLQVDHILPYSRSFDNSQDNKVLVLWTENQEKGNRTPFEWFRQKAKSDYDFDEKWNKFKDRIKNSHFSKEKRNKLLNKTFAEQEGDFQERNLNDSGYISKFIGTYLEKHLRFLEFKDLKNHIQRRSGTLTATLRECWSDEFDYNKNGFEELKEFLLNEIFNQEKTTNKNEEEFIKYTVNRKKSENKEIENKWVLCDEEKDKITQFFEEKPLLKNNFILEKLLEKLPEYGTNYNFLTKNNIKQKIKESMKWGGFWVKSDKDRSFSDKHHALDAILISLADQGMVQKLSVCNSIEKKKLQMILHDSNNSKETIEKSKKSFKNLIKKIFKAPAVNDKEGDDGKCFRDYVEEFLEERKIKEDGEYFEDYLRKLELNPDKKIKRKCRLFISHSSNNKVGGELFDESIYTNNPKYKDVSKKQRAKNYEDVEVDENKIGILSEFTKDNVMRCKNDRYNFLKKQSWARADIFKIINSKKNKSSFKIQEVFRKDLKNPNTPSIKQNEELKFLFSLYYNNYVLIRKDNNYDCCIGLYKKGHFGTNKFTIEPIENFLYKNNTGFEFDKNGRFTDITLTDFKIFKKFQIDSLGYINEIKNERQKNKN